ncbi:MAG: DUF2306 domain-containing protein [Bacteroidia bacterium]
MTRLGNIVWWGLLPLTAVIAVWIALRNLDAFVFRTDTGYLTTVGGIGRQWWFRVGFFLHVFTAIPVVLLGWVQFSTWLQRMHTTWHRRIGKTYVLLVLMGAAPGGLALAMGAAGGWAGKICFVMMSLLWFAFTLRAWLRIRKQDIQGHQADMQRSFALSFAAITLRLWMFLIGGVLEWRTPGAYALCAWLCWIPNILLLELWRWMRK